MMKSILYQGSVLVLVLLMPALAWSGSFRVVPIKVYFEPGKTSTVVKIVNEDQESLMIELDARKWSQDKVKGTDVLKKTKDLILFPKMLEIPPGKEKIVRVGYRGTPTASEQTYRIFVKELPVTKPGETALKFALRVGVPVFVKSIQPTKQLSIASTEVSDGKLQVRIKNSGNSHAVVGKVQAVGKDKSGKDSFSAESGGWYVLAGATREFTVGLPEKGCRKSSSINIDVKEGSNSIKSDVQVKAAQCKAVKG